MRRTSRLHVLDPDLDFLGRHADIDGDQQIAAVFGKLRADDRIRTVSLAEDFAILRGRLAHGVVKDAGARRRRVARIEEAAVVLFDGHTEIARAGQAVGEQLARFQVQDAILLLVFAAVADAIGEQLSVARDTAMKTVVVSSLAISAGLTSTSSGPSRLVRMQMEPRFSFARRRLKK